MEPERWRRVEQLYHSALQLATEQRSAFLDTQCSGDPALRQEVESLLSYKSRAQDFMENPALEQVARQMARDHSLDHPAGFAANTTVGHFRIVRRLGAGGMGVVYQAEDARLQREVALKFLPGFLAHDPAMLERFRGEARAASALNHPNICTIYEFGEHQGSPFIAMELLEGNPLNQAIAGKALAVDRVLAIGSDIAAGLVAAHDRGIIHRDIKPGNIFITKDGHAKILDFGLAKQLERTRGAFEMSELSTQGFLTAPGVPLGTYAYMSPEQALGREVDARTDLFSFGVTLYEMATGVLPFRGKTIAEISDAILNRSAAPANQLNPQVPRALEETIEKCLEKKADLRYQSAAEIAADLRRISHYSDTQRDEARPGRERLRPNWLKKWRYVAGALALLVATVTLLYSVRGPKKLKGTDTIVLADFINSTGDPVFDGTLRRGLAVQLEQSPFLSLVSDDRIQQTLKMMGQKPDATLTPEIARELCQRAGSAAVLDGSIAQVGTPYLVTVRAVNCATGQTLASTDAQASDKSHVLDVLGKTASEIRNKLGESLKTVEQFDTPLEQATTPSLEALKAFSSGFQIHISAGDAAAIPFYKHAIELDPNFALAYEWLGLSFNDLGEPSMDAYYTRRAYELRERTSEPERYFITARFHKVVTGNIEKAEQALQLWIQAYPRAALPHIYLAGAIYPVTGQYEKGVEHGREAIRLSPDFSPAYALPIFDYISLNRLDEAKAIYQQAIERKLKNGFFPRILYQIAFLQHDAAGMAQQVSSSAGMPGVEAILLADEADTAAYSGRLRKAREFSRRAVDSAERSGEKEAAATYSVVSSLREALFGNRVQARRQATLAMEHSAGHDVQYGSALALAYVGDDEGAQKLIDDLGHNFPEATIVQFNFLPTLRAKIAVSRGNPSNALESLRAATPYELGGTTYSSIGWTTLYPVYVRGEAYLAAHQGSEAAAEFQKVLDHPGMVGNEPIGALAHLGLARAYVLVGDTSKARAAYQDFLNLWKDADSDIPILKQAKAEYAKLQ